MLSTEHRQAMQDTFDRAAGEKHWTQPLEATARNGFLWLIKNKPLEDWQEWKGHSFWTNWRSHKSNNTSLHFAASSAKDPRSIAFLVQEGCDVNHTPPAHSTFSGPGAPPVFHALHRPMSTVVSFLQAFAEIPGANLQAPHNQKTLIDAVAEFGYWDAWKFLVQAEPFFDCANRSVEHSFVRHKNINGKNSTVTSVDVLKWSWDRWGEPTSEQLHDLWRNTLYFWSENGRRGAGVKFIKSLWNKDHPDWSEKDTMIVFGELLRRHDFASIKEEMKNGLVCTDEKWNKFRTEHSGGLWTEYFNELDALRTKVAIDSALASSDDQTRPSRTMRM